MRTRPMRRPHIQIRVRRARPQEDRHPDGGRLCRSGAPAPPHPTSTTNAHAGHGTSTHRSRSAARAPAAAQPPATSHTSSAKLPTRPGGTCKHAGSTTVATAALIRRPAPPPGAPPSHPRNRLRLHAIERRLHQRIDLRRQTLRTRHRRAAVQLPRQPQSQHRLIPTHLTRIPKHRTKRTLHLTRCTQHSRRRLTQRFTRRPHLWRPH